ncbi:Imm63 family immunity protein [Streptomyces sp. NPDC053792]|uniref:Imm63 family immunity protein n=1 Tax=Streptomyces sp. NPDC053792 TaxID=3365716 RepID=UPI0037D8D060
MQTAIGGMAARLDGVSRNDLVALSPQDAAGHFIDVRDGILHWVVVERGQELQRRTTGNLDELLHWVALDATFSMALRWELGQRASFSTGRDTRIAWLAKQIELLRRLDTEWAEQFRAGIPTPCRGVRLEDVDTHPLG